MEEGVAVEGRVLKAGGTVSEGRPAEVDGGKHWSLLLAKGVEERLKTLSADGRGARVEGLTGPRSGDHDVEFLRREMLKAVPAFKPGAPTVRGGLTPLAGYLVIPRAHTPGWLKTHPQTLHPAGDPTATERPAQNTAPGAPKLTRIVPGPPNTADEQAPEAPDTVEIASRAQHISDRAKLRPQPRLRSPPAGR